MTEQGRRVLDQLAQGAEVYTIAKEHGGRSYRLVTDYDSRRMARKTFAQLEPLLERVGLAGLVEVWRLACLPPPEAVTAA